MREEIGMHFTLTETIRSQITGQVIMCGWSLADYDTARAVKQRGRQKRGIPHFSWECNVLMDGHEKDRGDEDR